MWRCVACEENSRGLQDEQLLFLKPKVHTIRFMRPCVSCDSCILCEFYDKLHTTNFMQLAFVLISYCGKIICKRKTILRIMKKSNCLWIYIHDMIWGAAKVYERLQKSTRQVFTVHLSSNFFVYKLINSIEMTLSI